MKIGIVGYGFVGQAHEAALKEYHDILINDPDKGHYADISYADAIIICVSTPQADDGSCNIENVYSVIKDAPDVPILIKSTISLEGWDLLRTDCFNAKLAFSPEFLRAESALEDFKNTTHFMIGGDNTGFWAELFITAMGNIDVSTMSVPELILIKYFRNAFLATKVAFFNEIYDLCSATSIDYETVANGIGSDNRIGIGHTKVTAERGFGGHCFPKDVSAVLKTAGKFKNNLNILTAANNYNNQIRKDDD